MHSSLVLGRRRRVEGLLYCCILSSPLECLERKEEVTTFSGPLSQILVLSGGEGAVFMDFWRLCPSTVSSEPKGQNVT